MNVTLNGEPKELPAGATVATVVELLPNVPSGRGVAVAIDGEVVARAYWDATAIADGANVEVVTAIQGG